MIKLKSPAKVNLYLHVKHKRDDGFHEIETLFERISLHDVLTFRKTKSDIKLKVTGRKVSLGKKNLVYRAAHLLKDRYRIRTGVAIHLKKDIPVAAGLAGGSSNAATTLLGLNKLWKLNLSPSRLQGLAEELGSDVPFFILNAPYAIGKGKGEKLTALKSKIKLWHVLVTPKLEVLARDVYRSLTPGLLTLSRVGVRMLSIAGRKKNISDWDGRIFNTLEQVVLKMYPQIRRIKKDLETAGAHAVVVSGSGPTVFGTAGSKPVAKNIASRLKRKYPQAFIQVVSTA